MHSEGALRTSATVHVRDLVGTGRQISSPAGTAVRRRCVPLSVATHECEEVSEPRPTCRTSVRQRPIRHSRDASRPSDQVQLATHVYGRSVGVWQLCCVDRRVWRSRSGRRPIPCARRD